MEALTCLDCSYCVGLCRKFCMLKQAEIEPDAPYCAFFRNPVQVISKVDTGERRRAFDMRPA